MSVRRELEGHVGCLAGRDDAALRPWCMASGDQDVTEARGRLRIPVPAGRPGHNNMEHELNELDESDESIGGTDGFVSPSRKGFWWAPRPGDS